MLGVMEEHIFNEFTYSNLLIRLSINRITEPFGELSRKFRYGRAYYNDEIYHKIKN